MDRMRIHLVGLMKYNYISFVYFICSFVQSGFPVSRWFGWKVKHECLQLRSAAVCCTHTEHTWAGLKCKDEALSGKLSGMSVLSLRTAHLTAAITGFFVCLFVS